MKSSRQAAKDTVSPGDPSRGLIEGPDKSVESAQRDEYLRHLRNLFWQRVANFPILLLSSALIVFSALQMAHMIALAPDVPVNGWEAIMNWRNETEFRHDLREGLWRVAAVLFALLGLTSLAQIPGDSSDIEIHVRHRISQYVAIMSALGLACYAWLTLPLNEPEIEGPQSWYGLLALIVASAIAMLTGPDKAQRLANVAHLEFRISRIEKRNGDIRHHFSRFLHIDRAPRRVQLWVTREWREAVNDDGYTATYGLRPELSKRNFLGLCPLWPFVLPAGIWAAWVYSLELALGQPADAWAFPAAVSFLLLASSAIVTAVHYSQMWDAAISSGWLRLLPVALIILMAIFWLTITVSISRGSLTYFIGNFVCVFIAICAPFIGHKLNRTNMLELERRSLAKKKQQSLGRQRFLEDIEKTSRAGLPTR